MAKRKTAAELARERKDAQTARLRAGYEKALANQAQLLKERVKLNEQLAEVEAEIYRFRNRAFELGVSSIL